MVIIMTFYVNSTASLKAALESQNSNVECIITGSFELTEYAHVNNKTVRIISDGSAPHVISMNSAYNFQVRNGGNLILGDGAPLMLSGTVIGIINVVDNSSIVVNEGIAIINKPDKLARYALHLNGENATGIINGGYIEGYVALDLRNGARITEIKGGEFIGEISAIDVIGADSKIEKISGGVFWGKTDVAIKTESSILIEPGLSGSKGVTRFSGKNGVVSDNDSLLILPDGYKISSQTEPVNGITGTEFVYLTKEGTTGGGNEDDINVRFPDICFDEKGVYEFTVRETSTSGDGWITDPREYPVIVTVTDDGYGKLKAHVEYPEGEPKFVNKYKPKTVCIKITAIKTAIGAPLKNNQFEFGVFDEDGKKIASAKNYS
jgi:pilin isopeptide linkage protein